MCFYAKLIGNRAWDICLSIRYTTQPWATPIWHRFDSPHSCPLHFPSAWFGILLVNLLPGPWFGLLRANLLLHPKQCLQSVNLNNTRMELQSLIPWYPHLPILSSLQSWPSPRVSHQVQCLRNRLRRNNEDYPAKRPCPRECYRIHSSPHSGSHGLTRWSCNCEGAGLLFRFCIIGFCERAQRLFLPITVNVQFSWKIHFTLKV